MHSPFSSATWTIEVSHRSVLAIAVPMFPDFDRERFGHIMVGVFPTLPRVVGMTAEEVAAGVAAGETSFLFDGNGDFISDHARTSRNAGSGDRG